MLPGCGSSFFFSQGISILEKILAEIQLYQQNVFSLVYFMLFPWAPLLMCVPSAAEGFQHYFSSCVLDIIRKETLLSIHQETTPRDYFLDALTRAGLKLYLQFSWKIFFKFKNISLKHLMYFWKYNHTITVFMACTWGTRKDRKWEISARDCLEPEQQKIFFCSMFLF